MSVALKESDHKPVMLAEVLEYLRPRPGGIYVDGTFGAGGYTRAILEAADCVVVATDRDPEALARAKDLQAAFGQRFVFIADCFGNVRDVLRRCGYEKVDGFVLDLGVSSMQLDEAERGFSFRFDGPLDMRMNPDEGQSAADLVNQTDETSLANLIYQYGEERLSRRIAKAIVMRRHEQPFTRTLDLADLVRGVVPKSPKDKSDPATRTFQALRIAVNDELGELKSALAAVPDILKPGGRVVVVSFHSLEDGIVKEEFRTASGAKEGVSRYLPAAGPSAAPLLKILTKKALPASASEAEGNPRARSAKLRAAERLEEGV